jgi:hypothetical protein
MGLLGDATGLERDGLVADFDGFTDDHERTSPESCGRGAQEWARSSVPVLAKSGRARALESKSERATSDPDLGPRQLD